MAAERTMDASAQVSASAAGGQHFAMLHASGVMSSWVADAPLVAYTCDNATNSSLLLDTLSYALLNGVPLSVVLYQGDAYHLDRYAIASPTSAPPVPPPVLPPRPPPAVPPGIPTGKRAVPLAASSAPVADRPSKVAKGSTRQSTGSSPTEAPIEAPPTGKRTTPLPQQGTAVARPGAVEAVVTTLPSSAPLTMGMFSDEATAATLAGMSRQLPMWTDADGVALV